MLCMKAGWETVALNIVMLGAAVEAEAFEIRSAKDSKTVGSFCVGETTCLFSISEVFVWIFVLKGFWKVDERSEIRHCQIMFYILLQGIALTWKNYNDPHQRESLRVYQTHRPSSHGR